MSSEFAVLQRKNVVRSLTNPRTIFDPAYIQELADSFKAHSVLQPLLVRPLPASRLADTPRNVTHEIVCGECRDRGCELAGVDEYPVLIKNLSDDEVLEIQLIENLKRRDLTEMEEAHGYRKLMDHTKMNADEIGEKIGKSRNYVYGRLKLLNLCAEGSTSLSKKEIDFSIALVIARIPDSKQQVKALKEILAGSGYYSSATGREPMSQREALHHVQTNYMLKLSTATFNIENADLLPAAGSCKTCHKRTGHDPDLFKDVKSADLCIDPSCFHKKQEAHSAQLVAAAKVKGQTVIAGKEAQELQVGYGANARFKGYKRLDEKEDSPTGEPLRNILSKEMEAKGIKPTMLEHPTKKGKLIAALPNDVANSLLKAVQAQAKADKKAAPAAVQELLKEKASQEQARLDAKFAREVHAQIIAETWAEIQNAAPTPEVYLGHFNLEVHRYLAEKAAWNLDSEASEAICKLLDLGAVGARHGLATFVKKAADPDRLHLLFLMYSRNGDGFDVVTKAVHGTKLANFKKRIEAEVKERVYPKVSEKKASTPTAPAAQAKPAAGKVPVKAAAQKPLAQKPKLSAEEATQGIAAAMQGLERPASAPGGAVAPTGVLTYVKPSVMYRGPGGETWSGRGMKPKWVAVHLERGGDLNDLLVKDVAKPEALTPVDAWPFPKPNAAPAAAVNAEPTDPLYVRARAPVVKAQQANMRLLKEELGVGQSKALALLEQLTQHGVVSAAAERQARKVLVAA